MTVGDMGFIPERLLIIIIIIIIIIITGIVIIIAYIQPYINHNHICIRIPTSRALLKKKNELNY